MDNIRLDIVQQTPDLKYKSISSTIEDEMELHSLRARNKRLVVWLNYNINNDKYKRSRMMLMRPI